MQTVLSEMYLCACTYLNASIQENTVLRIVYESTVTRLRHFVAV